MTSRMHVGTAEIEVQPPYVALKRLRSESRIILHCSKGGEVDDFALLLEEAGAGKLAQALREASQLARRRTTQLQREQEE